jgi:hypothetical protein
MPSRENMVENKLFSPFIELGLRMRSRAFVATADYAISANDAPVLLIDPGGAGRTVLLPAEADSKDLCFFIFNTADAAEVLTIEEDGSTTAIETLAQGKGCFLHCDGTTWRAFSNA